MNPIERTDLWYLFAAYSSGWIIMFGFLLRMRHHAQRLQREMRLLKKHFEIVEERPTDTPEVPNAPFDGPSV